MLGWLKDDERTTRVCDLPLRSKKLVKNKLNDEAEFGFEMTRI